MHTVFTTPELLRTILAFCEEDTILTNLTISKTWSEISLDILWFEVDSLRKLVAPLGPVRRKSVGIGHGGLKLAKNPTFQSWLRFETHYCSRVRVMRIDFEEQKDYEPVLNVIARLRSLPLFPRLHTIQWLNIRGPAGFQNALIFMQHSVRTCTVSYNYRVDAKSQRDFYDALKARMPLISTLELMFVSDSDTNVQYGMANLVQGFNRLRHLVLPPFRDSSVLMSSVAELPDLASISFLYPPEADDNDIEVAQYQHLETTVILSSKIVNNTSGTFQALTCLDIPTHYQLLSAFLPHVQGLISLTVRTNIVETPAGVEHLVIRLAQYCPQLTLACLMVTTQKGYFPENQVKQSPDSEDVVRFCHIRQILECQQVTEFEIQHPYLVDFSQEDIEIIASRWNSLKRISLNPIPSPRVQSVASRLNLRALLCFARHCPQLEAVGLIVDTQSDPLRGVTHVDVDGVLPYMSQLRRLDIGASTLSSSAREGVAIFLHFIVPPSCSIAWGSSWCEVDEVFEEHWQFVRDSLPLLARMRRVAGSLLQVPVR